MAGGKRKHGEESPEQIYTNKSRSRPSVEARVDPTYGQRSAIPGLDDETTMEGEEEWLNNEDNMSALAYLKAVRQEATGIPNLLVAPKQISDECDGDVYEDGVGDYRGVYEDGAYYTSEPISALDDVQIDDGGLDPQLAYFDSILARFETVRAQLAQQPPAEAIRNLGKDHPTHVEKLNTEIARWWRWRMRTVDPLPVQIACMDKSTVLRLLGLLTSGTLLKKGMEVEVGISRWAWGLLARLPERGELTSEEIGVVRELGKKSVLVGMGLREDKQWDDGINEVEAGYEDDDAYTEEPGYANGEEIQLVMDDELEGIKVDSATFDNKTSAQQIGPQLPAELTSRNLEKGKGVGHEDHHMGATIINSNAGTRNGDHESEIFFDEVDEVGVELEDISTAKARLLARLNGQDPAHKDNEPTQAKINQNVGEDQDRPGLDPEIAKWNTRATVDMIITVAGEIFGQRDLLEFRSMWGTGRPVGSDSL